MQKKTLFALLAMLAISVPAFSIELPQGATPTFEKDITAYASGYKFNELLEAYGLKLAPEAVSTVPTSYAKVADNNVVFNNDSIAYTPVQYHSILTAYGLLLTPEDVTSKLGGVSSYATVKDGEIVFGKDSVAYDGKEWNEILSAYSLPEVAAPVVVPAGCPDEDGDGVCDDQDACPGTPKGIAVDERGCWALSSAVLFDFDKAVIKKQFYPELDKTKKIFDDYPTMRVQIDGHTDSVGTDKYNQKLSERRANAVMKYLVNKVGIEANRLKAVGYGESKPAYPNDTAENRSKNRRVEFTPAM
ncbi:OmpA family protein [Desulfopila sp. IMCC35006]|uniref:OmpA family protein n=1 Tax=Desulfopila sp. IMCC35006 TaxID=2569542 RepID=UPI0010AD9E64|nr:OmpA family protein [Desulfopila sp. IMCC35006]TKB28014.1 OmpA family protein [Desulfopila sp. IMCC35006]